MVRYASQACVRPSEATNPLPDTILQDINTVMTQLRADMAQQLATECERWDGEWVDTVWTDTDNDNKHDTTGHTLNSRFYRETNASTKWGFCGERTIDIAEPYKYEITLKNKVGDYQTCSNPSPPEDSYIYVAYGETMPPIGQVIDGKPAKIGIPICNNTLNKYEFAGYKNKNGELIYNASGNPQIPTWNQQSDATLEAQWVNKD